MSTLLKILATSAPCGMAAFHFAKSMRHSLGADTIQRHDRDRDGRLAKKEAYTYSENFESSDLDEDGYITWDEVKPEKKREIDRTWFLLGSGFGICLAGIQLRCPGTEVKTTLLLGPYTNSTPLGRLLGVTGSIIAIFGMVSLHGL